MTLLLTFCELKKFLSAHSVKWKIIPNFKITYKNLMAVFFFKIFLLTEFIGWHLLTE